MQLTSFAAELFNMTEDDLMSASRKQEYVIARMWCMTRASIDYDIILTDIGKFFGRHHSTVVHAIQSYNAALESRGISDYKSGFMRADFAWKRYIIEKAKADFERVQEAFMEGTI